MPPKFELTSDTVYIWADEYDSPKSVAIPNVTLNKYIGCGAHGLVFSAVDNLGRKVAVKIWYSYAPETVARAHDEIRKLAYLEGQIGIVTVYLFGTINETPYAIMELISEQSAKDWLKSFSPSLITRLAVWKGYA